jgi:hypothetical protein
MASSPVHAALRGRLPCGHSPLERRGARCLPAPPHALTGSAASSSRQIPTRRLATGLHGRGQGCLEHRFEHRSKQFFEHQLWHTGITSALKLEKSIHSASAASTGKATSVAKAQAAAAKKMASHAPTHRSRPFNAVQNMPLNHTPTPTDTDTDKSKTHAPSARIARRHSRSQVQPCASSHSSPRTNHRADSR